MKTLTIIDTFGFLFRSYYALPPLKSSSGFPTGLLTGFMNFIFGIGKDFKTDYLVFALDSKGETFRNGLYELYKANRQEVPEDLLKQLPVAIEFIEMMGFKTARCDGFEADDIIASLATQGVQMGLEVQIVSHDKDLYQLINDGTIYLFDPQKKEKITSQKCFEKYGVYPCQFIDYQSLVGDSIDNVPGVKGIGKKTAETLIGQFGSLDSIYENLANIESKRQIALLEDGKAMAYLSKTLVSLRHDAHIIDNINEFVLPSQNPILKIADKLKEYDLHNILKKVQDVGLGFKTNAISENELQEKLTTTKIEHKKEFILLDSDEKLQQITSLITPNSLVAFDTETDSLDTKEAKIIGFSFALCQEKSYYVPLNHTYLGVYTQVSHKKAKEFLIVLNQANIIMHNAKYDIAIIKQNFEIELGIFADTMILAWLYDSSALVGLDALSQVHLNHSMISFGDVVKKDETFAMVDLQKACEYAAEDAWATRKLYFIFEHLLKQSDEALLQLAQTMEYPFIRVLIEMERNGITIDTAYLKGIKTKNQDALDILTKEIHTLAGSVFNINSTKQLGVVLFETLKLPALKKTKTGYSTDEQALQELIGQHEIVAKLLAYRELFKLKSTYIEPLLEYAANDKHSRVYTSFLHTGTATGRLSSKNPNLQNIPVKTQMGKEIRNAFIAPAGKLLLGIDYSQIELRLLAHFCKDNALVQAFKNGEDIHMQTAIKLFGTDEAKDKRSIAKSINFGLIYGMGAKKLSQTLGISPKEAKGYIENYFETFPTIKAYLETLENFVQNNGYVYTLLGHKRVFDFSHANAMLKAAYIREGVNTVFQGSAADIIKLSMNEIFRQISNHNEIKLLLQIHDELVFEVDENHIEKYSKLIGDIMTNILVLEVPLDVSVNIGKNWGNLK